jgi:hypothetical protein
MLVTIRCNEWTVVFEHDEDGCYRVVSWIAEGGRSIEPAPASLTGRKFKSLDDGCRAAEVALGAL